jgi:formate/nitrite transporter FocA (FNT family)
VSHAIYLARYQLILSVIVSKSFLLTGIILLIVVATAVEKIIVGHGISVNNLCQVVVLVWLYNLQGLLVLSYILPL